MDLLLYLEFEAWQCTPPKHTNTKLKSPTYAQFNHPHQSLKRAKPCSRITWFVSTNLLEGWSTQHDELNQARAGKDLAAH